MMRKIINFFHDNYDEKTMTLVFFSVLISLFFALYNGFIGLMKSSLWNASICIYYLFLVIIRLFLLVFEIKSKRKGNKKRDNFIIIFSFALLLVMTIAMLTPISLLVVNKREYDLGLIPAITMAAYTTYSITMSVINIKKATKSDNAFVKQVRLINLISALMSVLVLQNTLILANGEYDHGMQILSACSSFAVIVMVLLITGIRFGLFLKRIKGEK